MVVGKKEVRGHALAASFARGFGILPTHWPPRGLWAQSESARRMTRLMTPSSGGLGSSESS